MITKYKKREDKIGEVVLNKQGTPMKIIEYRNTYDCDVEFQDKYKYVFKNAIYNNFLQGKIKNPYDVTVFGMGMIGDGKYQAKYTKNEISKDYRCWANMVERCYQNKELHLSYYQIVTVCDEWLNFQNFAEWYHNNWYQIPNNERLQLDKDILFPNTKIYSPETCMLVPQRINLLFTNKSNNSGLPNGINLTPSGTYSVSYNTRHLGCFPTIEKAYSVYATEKEKAIRERADEYKEYIPKQLYEALYKYEVKIENDKNYNYKKEK